MKTKQLTMLAAALVLSTAAIAQKVKLQEGDLSPLKGEQKFNVQYVYDGMTVTTKNVPEEEFISNKKSDLNQKEPGKGDKWAEAWKADRSSRFEQQFKEEFDKQSGAEVGNFADAKYTLIFKTTHTEMGYNIGISRRPAYIDGVLTVVETGNPDKVIARLSVDDCPGRTFGGGDFESGLRLQESYAVAGKGVGKFFRKKL